MAQSGYGKVVIFEDFLAGEDIVAEQQQQEPLETQVFG